MKNRLRPLFCLLLGALLIVFCATTVSAEPQVITLTDDIDDIKINRFLEIAQDKDKQLTIEQLITPSQSIDKQFNTHLRGINIQEQFWLRFNIHNQSQLDYFLFFEQQGFSEIEVFQLSAQSNTEQIDKVVSTPQKILPLSPQVLQIYPLQTTTEGQIHNYYLRLISPSKSLPSIHLKTHTKLLESNNSHTAFYALIMGAMLIISAYQLILFIILRESIYGSLTVALLGQTYLLANTNGLFQFFTNASGTIHFNSYNAVYLLTVIGALDFIRRVIDAKTYVPFINKMFLGIILILSCSLLFYPLLEHAGSVINYAVLGIMPLALISVIKAKSKGRRFATSLILVVPVYLLTVTPFLLTVLGYLDNTDLYMKIMHIGLLIASILFSLTLAETTREIQESRRVAQAANEAKGKFIANISHELRTPMNATIGLTQLLQQTSLNPRQQSYIDKLLTSSQHMMKLIDKLLEFSKSQANQLKLDPRDFSLQTLLNNVAVQVEDACQRKNIHFAMQVDPRCPDSFVADSTSLGQVLINLTNNAVKFTHSGCVTLTVTLVAQTDTQASLLFEVKDTGIGLTKQQQQDIFEPFTMADMEYSRKLGGTGLGLTISQDILKLMDSHIEVSSAPQKGSTFSFSLWLAIAEQPVASDGAQHQTSTITSLPELQGKSVMVVDDDALNRLVADELLTALGLKVMLAESGSSLLSKLAKKKPDLILMDLQMPEADGYATMELLQSNRQFKQIPVVALTAHASSEDENRCLEAGMIGFITKPINLNEIQHILLSQLATPANLSHADSTERESQEDHRITQQFQSVIGTTKERPSQHFLETTRLKLQESRIELKQHLENAQWNESAKCAHRLLGSSHLYASSRLNHVLKKLNDQDFPYDEIQALQQELDAEFTNVINELDELLQSYQSEDNRDS